MKAVVVHQIGSFAWEERPLPVPGPNELRVAVAVTGLCRTDLKIIEHGHRDLILPRIPGDEVVGVVDAAGPGTDPDWIGARVYVYPGTACGLCPFCRSGADNLCRGMRIMGFHRDGGFASSVTVPARSVLRLPDDLSFDHAVLAEPLSCCLNALDQARLQPGEAVAIWGAGPAGTLLSRAARSRGATAVLIDPDPARRRHDEVLAAPPHNTRYAVTIPAVGSHDAYDAALAALEPRGRLVAFSGLLPDAVPRSFTINTLHYLEQSVVGAYGCAFRHGGEAVRLIASGAVRIDDLITHRLPLAALGEALDLVRSRSGMKILLYPEHETQTPGSP